MESHSARLFFFSFSKLRAHSFVVGVLGVEQELYVCAGAK